MHTSVAYHISRRCQDFPLHLSMSILKLDAAKGPLEDIQALPVALYDVLCSASLLLHAPVDHAEKMSASHRP